jgi:hypothetical protein
MSSVSNEDSKKMCDNDSTRVQSLIFEHAYRPFQSGLPITKVDLEALELAVGVTLPSDYKAFLMKCNGGSLYPFAFELKVPEWNFSSEHVHSLDQLYEIKEIYRRSQFKIDSTLRNIPPGRIAIGSTVSELTITLNVTEKRYGQIEAWVRDINNVWGEGTNRIIVPLAASFTDFLGMLRDLPEAYNGYWAEHSKSGGATTRITLP